MSRLTETQLHRICVYLIKIQYLSYLFHFCSFLWRYTDISKVIGALTTRTSLSPIQCGFASDFVNYKKDALDSHPQVIRLASCLSMVGGFLRLPPPPKLIAMIFLKVALNTINQSIKSNNNNIHENLILNRL